MAKRDGIQNAANITNNLVMVLVMFGMPLMDPARNADGIALLVIDIALTHRWAILRRTSKFFALIVIANFMGNI